MRSRSARGTPGPRSATANTAIALDASPTGRSALRRRILRGVVDQIHDRAQRLREVESSRTAALRLLSTVIRSSRPFSRPATCCAAAPSRSSASFGWMSGAAAPVAMRERSSICATKRVQTVRLLLDDLGAVVAARGDLVRQPFDRRERSAQIVRHGREHGVLGAVRLLKQPRPLGVGDEPHALETERRVVRRARRARALARRSPTTLAASDAQHADGSIRAPAVDE